MANRGPARRFVSAILPLSIKERGYLLLRSLKRHHVALRRNIFPLKRWVGRHVKAGARPEGVNLVAYIRAETGLGEAARGLASVLDAAGIQFGVVNIEQGNYARHGDLSWARKEMSNPPYDVTIVSINPDHHHDVLERTPAAVLGDTYVIGNWFWELSNFPSKWSPVFSFFDEIWAPSRFVEDAILRKSPVPVVRIPPVVKVCPSPSGSRSSLRLPEDRFLFLTMFDLMSFSERKNPGAALRAYKQAFPRVSDNIGFVLKISGTAPADAFMNTLAEEVSGRPDIFVIDRMLTRAEITSLLAVCDCFVSLHRSEGFGFPAAEAMYLGKPAILTNWSGNTDYMTAENSIAINYRLVKLGRDYGPYQADQQWADPDVSEAAYWMARIAQDEQMAKRIGRNAQATIRTSYSPQAVGELVKKRFDAIRQRI